MQVQAQTTVKKYSAKEFSELLSTIKNGQLIDVRTLTEFQKGHLNNALNLNIQGSEFESQLATLNKTEPVLIYCLSGTRSTQAANRLTELGFTDIHELSDGILAWRSLNLPETKFHLAKEGMRIQEFESLLQADQYVLVDFYAPWCAPCKKMQPYLEDIANEMKGQIKFLQINIDENPELAKELNVSTLPYLKFYNQNKVTWKINRYIEEPELREKLHQLIN